MIVENIFQIGAIALMCLLAMYVSNDHACMMSSFKKSHIIVILLICIRHATQNNNSTFLKWMIECKRIKCRLELIFIVTKLFLAQK